MENHALEVWDLQSHMLLHSMEGHSARINAVEVTPDGRRLISASEDRTLRVWDLESGSLVASFTDEGGLRSACASPDGQTIIAGGATGQVHFLRLEGTWE